MNTPEKKVEQILHEMSECREDDRNAQDQLLQTIGNGSGLLGILTGVSFAGWTDGYARWLFVLGVLTFLVVFGYAMSLGIPSVIRYHYLQDLEDQLNRLMNNDPDVVVAWKSFSSPITTRNPKHIKSKFAKINFGALSVSTISALVICLGLIVMLFSQIENHTLGDWLFAVFFVIATIVCGYEFYESCTKGREIFRFCKKESLEKRSQRLSFAEVMEPVDRFKKDAMRNIWCIFKYYSYPRLSDLQKPFLIIIGYIVGWLFFGIESANIWSSVRILFWAWLVVDFLVYQARFIWNDIRGLDGDLKAGKTNRIPIQIMGVSTAVKISLVVIAVRLFAAVCVMIFIIPDVIRTKLWIVIGIIIIVALLYEMCSEKGISCGVYILVSVGYPIRMVTGLIAVKPDFLSATISCGNSILPGYTIIFVLVAVGLIGVFSSLLSWCHQAHDQEMKGMTFTKQYYAPLFKQLGERSKNVEPLKEKGNLRDLWNATMFSAMLMLASMLVTVAKGKVEFVPVIFSEVCVLVCVLLLGRAGGIWIRNFLIISVACIIGKILWISCVIEWDEIYCVVSGMQIFTISVYFCLRCLFKSDFDFIAVCLGLLRKIIDLVIGEKTKNLIKLDMNK